MYKDAKAQSSFVMFKRWFFPMGFHFTKKLAFSPDITNSFLIYLKKRRKKDFCFLAWTADMGVWDAYIKLDWKRSFDTCCE